MFVKKPMNMKAYENGSDKWGNRFGGGGFQDSINTKSLGLEKWKPQEGENLIDLIPFNATKENPLVIAGKAEEGDPMYSLDYFVHKDVGPGHANITCLTQYGDGCPLCKEYERLKVLTGAENEKKAIAMKAKRRVVYVVHDLKTGKFGYWDTGWKSVEEKITKKARVTIDPETGAPINAFDWENGWSLKFYGEKKQYNGKDYIEPDMFDFVKRPPLSDEVLAHSVDLATVIKKTSPEDMEKLLCGKSISNNEVKTEHPSTPVVNQFAKTPVPEVKEEPKKEVPQTKTESLVQAASEPETEQTESNEVCPYGHAWHDADKHSECSKCTRWEDCVVLQ